MNAGTGSAVDVHDHGLAISGQAPHQADEIHGELVGRYDVAEARRCPGVVAPSLA